MLLLRRGRRLRLMTVSGWFLWYGSNPLLRSQTFISNYLYTRVLVSFSLYQPETVKFFVNPEVLYCRYPCSCVETRAVWTVEITARVCRWLTDLNKHVVL